MTWVKTTRTLPRLYLPLRLDWSQYPKGLISSYIAEEMYKAGLTDTVIKANSISINFMTPLIKYGYFTGTMMPFRDWAWGYTGRRGRPVLVYERTDLPTPNWSALMTRNWADGSEAGPMLEVPDLDVGSIVTPTTFALKQQQLNKGSPKGSSKS